MKQRIGKAGAAAAVLLAFGAMYAWRFRYAGPFAGTWDTVDFAMALSRFDLLEMQPHFPGYPYFILGGMLVHNFVENPARALSIFNVLMSLSSCIPVYWLARRKLPPISAGLLCLAVQGLSYNGLLAAGPMSEGTALAVLWWYLWSLVAAMESRKWTAGLLPLFLFGLLMGVRLSYAAFGAGLLFPAYTVWKRGTAGRAAVRLVFLGAAGLLFQLIWITGLAYTEGGYLPFFKLAVQFTGGHFNDWGGAVTSSGYGLGERLVQLAVNVIWAGVLGSSVWSAVFLLCALTGGLLIRKNSSFNRALVKQNMPDLMMLSVMGLYLTYAYFAQNVDKPRHIMPVVVMGVWFAGGWLLRRLQHRPEARRQRVRTAAGASAALFLVCQLGAGAALVREQYTEKPASYQLTAELERMEAEEGNLLVFAWEEDRVMKYLQAGFEHKRVFTWDFFKAEAAERKEARILLTGEVVRGFEEQGIDMAPNIRKIREFRSNQLVDPVYHYIVLYEWIP
ncbi:glycosyltransferase family 39 protein [Paenibacillus gansuensis]|uniref:Glycosyltransferase family 39 protein n=1 Tax=Paenibacillus gansuensis TaxID=306542 RepID=A0ABW5PIB3_9BACL